MTDVVAGEAGHLIQGDRGGERGEDDLGKLWVLLVRELRETHDVAEQHPPQDSTRPIDRRVAPATPWVVPARVCRRYRAGRDDRRRPSGAAPARDVDRRAG